MNKILLSLTTCFFLLRAHSQTGYHIQLTLKPYKEGKVYLGYYYGKIRALADSAMLDGNGAATFTGKEKLPGGV